MDIDLFLLSLLHELSGLDFVEEVDFETEVFIIKGRAILKNNRFLQVYFNELTGTVAFTLIKDDKRIWGIDFDNIRGWHLHPLGNSEEHHDINSMTIEEIIDTFKKVWLAIPQNE